MKKKKYDYTFYTYLKCINEGMVWKLHATKTVSIHKVVKFLERYNLLELKQEEIETINSPISVK